MDELWPILILWVIAVLFGGARKKKAPPRPSVEDVGTTDASSGGLLGDIGKALEELKKAELEARRKLEGAGAGARAPQEDAAARARQYLAQRKAAPARPKPERKVFLPQPKPARPAARRPSMPLADDDADKTSEDGVVSLEVTDYDLEAERIVAERQRAAERRVRVEASVEELSAAQAARRKVGREGTPIGGAAEHAQWHERIAAAAPPAAAPRPKAARDRLSRYADGSLKGALVLSEVLGRPVGER